MTSESRPATIMLPVTVSSTADVASMENRISELESANADLRRKLDEATKDRDGLADEVPKLHRIGVTLEQRATRAEKALRANELNYDEIECWRFMASRFLRNARNLGSVLRDIINDPHCAVEAGMRSEAVQRLSTALKENVPTTRDEGGCMMENDALATAYRVGMEAVARSDDWKARAAIAPKAMEDKATGECHCDAPECLYYNGKCNAPCLGPRTEKEVGE